MWIAAQFNFDFVWQWSFNLSYQRLTANRFKIDRVDGGNMAERKAMQRFQWCSGRTIEPSKKAPKKAIRRNLSHHDYCNIHTASLTVLLYCFANVQ
ncbi:hypothetical protein KIN20_023447 [Parelaphostrongylus tenuis]|uniref:Uncharacterized protein n=1 Tax=Parelaphostrongylus tenuis TaxID=148309 RepID=A0AAD5QSZ3_PARTN|nr:hypothetical protein KIN20_023447 [Parelaphostrongylus tenuis]